MTGRLKISAPALAAAVLLVAMTACFKSVKVDCNYDIVVSAESEKGGEKTGYSDVKIYTFKGINAAEWQAATYEDALAGRLTSLENASVKIEADGVMTNTDSLFNLHITEIPVTLLICDTGYEIYGWRDSGVVENLPKMSIIAVLQHWYNETIKDEGTSADGYSNIENGKYRRKQEQSKWTMVYVNPTPISELPGNGDGGDDGDDD